MVDQGITWLVSYPKSGNTWTRILLANFNANRETPIDINRIELHGRMSAHRPQFDEAIGLPSSDLTAEETDALRPRVFEMAAEQARKAGQSLYVKVHDAYYETSAGEPLFPASVTHKGIYLIRHPLDVAVSYTFHTGLKSFDQMIKQMADPNSYLAGFGQQQLQQKTMDWSGHVLSWTSPKPFPVMIVRYEDLLADTFSVFAKMIAFLELEGADDDGRIERAVEFSRFDRLRSREADVGFGERLESDRTFFRSGKAGDWRQHLTDEQAERICFDHRDVMKKFGYSMDGVAPLNEVSSDV